MNHTPGNQKKHAPNAQPSKSVFQQLHKQLRALPPGYKYRRPHHKWHWDVAKRWQARFRHFQPARAIPIALQFKLGKLFYLQEKSKYAALHALQWLYAPALQGQDEAIYLLARCYERLQCQKQALYWYLQGADRGDQRCMKDAARICRRTGKLAQARHYLDLLAQLGDPWGLKQLQIMDVFPHLRRGTLENAYRGQAEALFRVGLWYLCGPEATRKQHGEEAFGLAKLKQAADLGHETARIMYDGYLEAQAWWQEHHKAA